ncbi:MAG TPA: ATP-binding protein [Candidatus Dormibacteraeota bacterium]|jgi:hypothetical protein|nr:ATP-binding protein [Candidatus Dormibacteraeota bacterium]
MTGTASELRIPADPEYIVVAKRAAAGFGVVAGFGVEAVDDLVIAVTQACENAIAATMRAVGRNRGQVRLTFRLEDQRLEVQVRSLCGRGEDAAECPPEVGQPEVAGAPGKPVATSGQALIDEAARVREAAAAADLALRVMGLFVDDCRYRVDQRTGSLRVRLTKYRVS